MNPKGIEGNVGGTPNEDAPSCTGDGQARDEGLVGSCGDHYRPEGRLGADDLDEIRAAAPQGDPLVLDADILGVAAGRHRDQGTIGGGVDALLDRRPRVLLRPVGVADPVGAVDVLGIIGQRNVAPRGNPALGERGAGGIAGYGHGSRLAGLGWQHRRAAVL